MSKKEKQLKWDEITVENMQKLFSDGVENKDRSKVLFVESRKPTQDLTGWDLVILVDKETNRFFLLVDPAAKIQKWCREHSDNDSNMLVKMLRKGSVPDCHIVTMIEALDGICTECWDERGADRECSYWFDESE